MVVGINWLLPSISNATLSPCATSLSVPVRKYRLSPCNWNECKMILPSSPSHSFSYVFATVPLMLTVIVILSPLVPFAPHST